MGAFLLELHSMRGVASRELSRLQELIKEVGARTPEEAPSLTLQDFQVGQYHRAHSCCTRMGLCLAG